MLNWKNRVRFLRTKTLKIHKLRKMLRVKLPCGELMTSLLTDTGTAAETASLVFSIAGTSSPDLTMGTLPIVHRYKKTSSSVFWPNLVVNCKKWKLYFWNNKIFQYNYLSWSPLFENRTVAHNANYMAKSSLFDVVCYNDYANVFKTALVQVVPNAIS